MSASERSPAQRLLRPGEQCLVYRRWSRWTLICQVRIAIARFFSMTIPHRPMFLSRTCPSPAFRSLPRGFRRCSERRPRSRSVFGMKCTVRFNHCSRQVQLQVRRGPMKPHYVQSFAKVSSVRAKVQSRGQAQFARVADGFEGRFLCLFRGSVVAYLVQSPRSPFRGSPQCVGTT